MKKWMIPLVASLAVAPLAFAQLSPSGEGFHARMARWLHHSPQEGGGHLPPCLAQLLHGRAGHGEGIDAHLESMAALLELGGPQRKQVAAALTAALPDLEVRAQALVTAHGEQLERVHSADFDEAALRRASAEVAAAQEELVVAVARLLRDVHAVLTPEQLARISARAHPDLLGSVAEHVRECGHSARAWAARQ